MTLIVGDHLLIKRDGKILGPEDEAYHEFEVLETKYEGLDGKDSIYHVLLKIIR